MTKVLIPLADGFEETEAVAVIDILRRAGCEVVAASINAAMVKSAHGVRIMADALWHEVTHESFDVLVLPGGGAGTKALCADEGVLKTIRLFDKNRKIIGAICAAPLALQAAGVLKNRKVTAYPDVLEQLTMPETSESPVVIDGNIITSRGPGTVFAFALALVNAVAGPGQAGELAKAMLVSEP